MSLIKLTLEYDGTDFVGWQYQSNGRSVQEEIEKAIKQILQVDVRVTGGGRTDAGVHARGQVGSFLVEHDVEIQSLAKSLNAVLPKDVVVLEASEAPPDFNARYSARQRYYRYHINQEPAAIQRNYCWQVFYHLDVGLMQRCAERIQGEHDFCSFCKVDAAVQHHRCMVYVSKWNQKEKKLVFEIAANRFLYGMVRALVGTMVDVGRGYTTYDEFEKIIEARDRTIAGTSAPAKGLFLEEIMY